jgi:hypothetical protein
MKIVQQTIASLGPPTWMEPLERPYGSAVIARWRHLNGRLRISTADAKWDGDRIVIISAFDDAALQAKQLGLAE